jgi:hypothetical protein
MTSNQLLTATEALRFAVDFAQTDIEAVDVAEVERQIENLLNLPHYLDPRAGWAKVPKLGKAALQEMQASLSEFLANLTGIGTDEVTVSLTFWAVRSLKEGADQMARAKRDATAYEPRVDVLVHGQPRDWLLYRVIRLLEQVGAQNLKTCPAPECGRLFLKVTRKEFCSARCQSRIYMRGYRQQGKTAAHGEATKRRSADGKASRTR